MKPSSGSTAQAAALAALVCGLSAFAAANTRAAPLASLLPSEHAPTKPFSTFEEFYPFYLQEHSAVWTRRLHFIGTTCAFLAFLTHAGQALGIVSAVGIGVALVPFLRHIHTGAVEMACMVLAYLTVSRAGGASWSRIVAPLLVAYGLAWVSHFTIEGNKPATFIYPVFSLLGDWRMMYEMATGVIAF